MSDQSPTAKPWVIDATAATFAEHALERSNQVPVVVDFWAPWCGPCRILGPLLEKLVVEDTGSWVLVKVDTDQAPELASQFNVQSIPAVFGLVNGQVIESFVGPLPEDALRSWLDQLQLSRLLSSAEQLESEDPAGAEKMYREVLRLAPQQVVASIGLARVLLSLQREDEPREILQQLEERGFLEPEAEKLKALLDLRDKREFDTAARRKAAEADPDNLTAQWELAEALSGDGAYEQALQICVDLVQRDRPGVGEQARQLMIEIFRVLPADSDLIHDYRRKLSMALY